MKKVYVLLVLTAFISQANATWDSYMNNQKVAYVDGSQHNQVVIRDNAGGCYVVWQDVRLGNNTDQIYAQHFDSLGNPSWQENGIALAPTAKVQRHVQVFADGVGGVIAIWADHRDSISSTATNVDLWGQRINSTGTLMWGSMGKSLISEAGEQNNPLSVSHGKDGFVLAWRDGGNTISGRQSGFWMQRFDVSGNEQWAKGGKLVHQAGNVFSSSQQWAMCSDGAKGAVLVYNESGTNTDLASNIYGHRVDMDGKRHWEAEVDTIAGIYFIERGYPINKGKGNDNFPIIELGIDGELYICWQGKRDLSWKHGALFAQKMHVNGTLLWDVDGVKISPSAMDASNQFDMVLDHQGGIFFNYIVDKGSRRDLIRFDTAGKKDWLLPVTINSDISAISKMKRTSKDEIYVAWIATTINQNANNGIVIQKFDSKGKKLISGDEVISTYPEDKASLAIEVGLNDELFCAWGDYRRTNGQSSGNADVDLFIQRYVLATSSGLKQFQVNQENVKVIDGEAVVKIQFSDSDIFINEVLIIDMMGRICHSAFNNQLNSLEIDATQLRTGIYSVILNTTEGTSTFKFYHR